MQDSEMLSGTLEIVSLHNQSGRGDAIGVIGRTGQNVYVANGSAYVPREVLARTNKRNRYVTTQLATFISSDIPARIRESKGLQPDEYIFIGVLGRALGNLNLTWVNRFYEPGNMGYAAYFRKGEDGIWIPKRTDSPIQSYLDAFTYLLYTDPVRNSRAIFVESSEQLLPLENIIRGSNLVPIRMTPLVHIR